MARKWWMLACALFASALLSSAAQEIIINPDTRPNAERDQPAPTKAGTCKGNNCRLKVRVNGNCEITIDQQWAIVAGRNVRLVWEILPAGYSFPEVGGVEFKDNYNPMWREEFYDGRKVSAREWQWIDANNMPDVFRYTVRVVNDRTGQVCELDPGVVNDWP